MPPRVQSRRDHTDVGFPSIIRGLLVLKLTKNTKITNIDLSLEGKSTTEWPEGIGPRRQEVSEIQTFLSITTSLLDSVANRRALSLGPGTSYAPDDLEESPSSAAARTLLRSPERIVDTQTFPQHHPNTMHSRQMHQILSEDYFSAPLPPYPPVGSSPMPSVPIPEVPEADPEGLELEANGVSRDPQPRGRRSSWDHNTVNLRQRRFDITDVAVPQVPGTAGASITLPSGITARHRPLGRRDSFNSDDGDANLAESEEIPDPSIISIPEDDAIARVANAAVNSSPAPSLRQQSLSTPSIGSRSPASQEAPNSLTDHENRASGSPVYSRFPLNTGDNRSPRFGRQENPAADRSLSQDRRRSRSRFGLRALSSMFRELSQDVREIVGEVRRPSTRSASRGRHVLGLPHDSREDLDEVRRSVSSGRAISSSGDRGSVSRGPGRHPVDYDESPRRGRDMTISPIGAATERELQSQLGRAQQVGYKEFKNGTYTYPISFAIPSDSLPSLLCDFGRVKYTLSATVHRAGTFTTKLTAVKNVNVVSCLRPDSTDETEHLVVQRQWGDQLCYVIELEHASVTMGDLLPVNLNLLPLEKLSIYRISIALEEKTDYYAHGRRIVRHDPVSRWELISLRQQDKLEPLLPILSDSSTAGVNSPLAPYARPNGNAQIPPFTSATSLERADDAISDLLSPSGPWQLGFKLRIPDCSSKIHPTNKSPVALITVAHIFKVVMRVSSANNVDEKGKPKLFEIIVEMPINILSCKCKRKFMYLPPYERIASLHPSVVDDDSNREHRQGNPSSQWPSTGPSAVHSQSHWGPPSGRHRSSSSEPFSMTDTIHQCGSSSTPSARAGPIYPITNTAEEVRQEETTSLDPEERARAAQYARLVAGEVTPGGEAPPVYRG